MAELRIGTCSWKYPSWHGLVYSAPKGINYLEEYAHQYDTVEIDQWFWSLFGKGSIGLPNPADVERYRDSVPENFRFSIKVPNSITLTHFYRKRKTEPLVPNQHFLSPTLFGSFLSTMDPFGPMLGPLMFQFGYLNKQMIKFQEAFIEQFESFLREIPTSYRYAMEIRNPNYLNPSYFKFLERNKISPVLVQGYYMPSILDLYKRWRDPILRHRLVVIRLHGPDRKGIEKVTGNAWNRLVAPKEDELAGVADMVTEMLNRDIDVYVNVNNHYEGSAPLTIDRVRRLLQSLRT